MAISLRLRGIDLSFCLPNVLDTRTRLEQSELRNRGCALGTGALDVQLGVACVDLGDDVPALHAVAFVDAGLSSRPPTSDDTWTSVAST